MLKNITLYLFIFLTVLNIIHANPSKGQWKQFVYTDGLSSNYVTGIVVDEDNNLWISSKKGISFFDQSDSTFTNYGLEDGIGNIDFHRHSYDQSSDGNIYFGGPLGITKVNPREIQYNDYLPPCIITRVKKNLFDETFSETFMVSENRKFSE